MVVQLILRLTQADISCTTTARLFFFPLLAAELAMRVEYGLGGMKRVLLLDPCRMLTSLQFALINWKN